MQINSHLFQAAATIYSGLLEASTNQLPQDPAYAHQAMELAGRLFRAANQDGVLTNAAARILVGFLNNPRSGHCTSEELVAWSLTGARNLIDAFTKPLAPAVQPQNIPPQSFFTAPVPTMPPQVATPAPPPVPQPVPVFQQPTMPAEIPDFTEGKQ